MQGSLISLYWVDLPRALSRFKRLRRRTAIYKGGWMLLSNDCKTLRASSSSKIKFSGGTVKWSHFVSTFRTRLQRRARCSNSRLLCFVQVFYGSRSTTDIVTELTTSAGGGVISAAAPVTTHHVETLSVVVLYTVGNSQYTSWILKLCKTSILFIAAL